MSYRLATKFVAPEGTHTVLVVTAYYWGRGATKAEAMAQCKREGGAPGRDGYIAYYFGPGIDPEVYVDQMGFVNWNYTGEERPQPVREEVGLRT